MKSTKPLEEQVRLLTKRVARLEAIFLSNKRKVRIPPPRLDPTYEIKRIVSEELGVRITRMTDETREPEATMPKHFAMNLCKDFKVADTTVIAHCFGLVDHTSTTYAAKSVKRWRVQPALDDQYLACFERVPRLYSGKTTSEQQGVHQQAA